MANLSRSKILITAGPTREMLDPVRFISNVSTGEMGYAVARAAARKGHRVTLISGPTALKPPAGIRFKQIFSADDLQRACKSEFPRHDILIMIAAVCDFAAERLYEHKIRRTRTKQIRLKRTPDIVAGLAKRKGGRIVIGFCLETEDWLENARQKLKRKNLDGIVANYYSKGHIPFGDRKINTAFIPAGGRMIRIRRKAKSQIALQLLDWIRQLGKK